VNERLPRLPTGIPGLDLLLDGGFIEGTSYIIQGRPGAGKTIFSNQAAFAHAARGGKVLYITLLAETHQRLFQSLSILSFFDKQHLDSSIAYVSVFRTLVDEGLNAVVDLLRAETKRVGATLLVFDGLLNARDRADTELDAKKFVAAVQNQAAFVGCTVLFLTSTRLMDESPEHTMVDGVIDLNSEIAGVRFVRSLQVLKSRGSASLGGSHYFVINDDGVVMYPRIEVAYATPTRRDAPEPIPIASGVDGLDDLIGGGLPSRSVTLLLGPSGAGKTSFGLSFLSAASMDAPALYFGFYETPERLLLKARSLGCPLDSLIEAGTLDIIWRPLNENILDCLGHELLEAVRRRGVRRLVIDALGGFERAAVHKERLVEFFATLTNELRALGVTAIATWEMRDLFGHDLHAPTPEISSILDNLMVLRSLRLQSQYKRVLSVLKIRDCAIEPAMHEVIFSKRGLRVSAAAQMPSDHPDLLPKSSEGL
jgi:circadian clock protein KaiC